MCLVGAGHVQLWTCRASRRYRGLFRRGGRRFDGAGEHLSPHPHITGYRLLAEPAACLCLCGATMTAWGEAQYDNVYAPGIEHHWWHLARGHIIRHVIDSFPATTILDVGCGPGVMVGYLRQRGYECYGCELARPAVIGAARDTVWTE